MSTIDLSKRRIGVNFNEQQSDVLVWAPQASGLSLLIGNDPDQPLPLRQQEYGYWDLQTDQLKPGDRYELLIHQQDGAFLKRPDPASLSQQDGVHGVSTAYDLSAFQWTDGMWKGVPLEAYILYELHVGTFSPAGDFGGLERQLDYLVGLGITAIELMPVAQFPGNRNWGYDGVYPFAVQASYGGPEGLQQLVDRCHAKGLAVVLDVVYNHMGPEGNYFGDFGPYFTEKYHTPWGNAINFDDEWSDGVRHYFIENVLMWFRDFHIDALRMDAVHAIKDFGALHILEEIKGYTQQLSTKTGRRHYLIVESDLNDPKYIDPGSRYGYGMDAQWIDEFHHALRVTAGQQATGYYSDFNGLAHLEKSFHDGYVYDGTYSPHRKKTFGRPAKENPGKQFVVFSQNHDQVGNRMLGERSAQLLDFSMLKVLAGAVLCSPYLPMLFMGEEWAESNPFLYFVSHGDESLVAAVRDGRKAEFASFHASGTAPDPQSEDTFMRSKLQWELLESGDHARLFSFYQSLIAIRKKSAAIYELNRKHLKTETVPDARCLMLHRWHEEQHILCFLNFSDAEQQMRMPSEKPYWKKLMDSNAPEWGGRKASPQSLEAGNLLQVPASSFLLYTSKHV